MAPTADDLDGLKKLVAQLEKRIDQLEHGSSGKSKADELRMILMGPPGAGR